MATGEAASGPLRGVRVVEMAGIGPGPFCATMLSDMGAQVLRIDRVGNERPGHRDVLLRGRGSIQLDLKRLVDLDKCRTAIARADVLIEGFRPGVMERLGLGPVEMTGLNPRLVYGRMTGWGQTGPWAGKAGHDINYIGLTGALHAIGDPLDPPPPPLNLLGDFGGGAMFLAFGIGAALYERERSGRGQVIDAAIVDGTSMLMAQFGSLVAADTGWLDRGGSVLTGAAPNYRSYECADGGFVAVGAIEPEFYRQFLAVVGDPYTIAEASSPAAWPDAAERLSAVFRTRPRDEWVQLALAHDACLTPVLTLQEAPRHPQMAARKSHVDVEGVAQPVPAPRFSRTPGAIQGLPAMPGEGGEALLESWVETI